MSTPSEADELTLSFAGLRIRIGREGQSEAAAEESSSLSSFSIVRSPTSGALARPSGASGSPDEELLGFGATDSHLVEAPIQRPYGSPAWRSALLSAVTPEDFESLDLSGARHLFSRLRSSPGGWTPAARIGRALKCGVVARCHLDLQPTQEAVVPGLPLTSKIFVVLRGAPGQPAGWTDHQPTFRAATQGRFDRAHADAVCHGFASRAEGEAYCLGAERVWRFCGGWTDRRVIAGPLWGPSARRRIAKPVRAATASSRWHSFESAVHACACEKWRLHGSGSGPRRCGAFFSKSKSSSWMEEARRPCFTSRKWPWRPREDAS